MSGFDYISLIKRQAKARAKTQSIKLSAAQKSIAVEGGFAHYHELRKVASKDPDDIRLMRLALQTDDLKEVVYGEELYEQIDHILEGELSAHMAETNADGFCMDELTVDKVAYDQTSGVLSILSDIVYSGDQKPDRPYSGTTFYVHVIICLFRHVDHWELHKDDRLRVVEVESDQDRDWQQQSHSIESLNDRSVITGAISAADLFKTGRLSDIASNTSAVAKALESSNHLSAMTSSAIEASNLIPDVAKLTSSIDKLRKQGLI